MDIKAAMAELTTDLAAHADIRSASSDPAMVNTPGVLAQVETITADRLGGYTLRVRCLLISPDRDPARAMDALSTLLAAVEAVAGRPVGPVAASTVVLPSDPTPLPCLVYPLDLYPEP